MQSETNRPRPVVLCVLDGWGQREDPSDNAIALANTPEWDRMSGKWPMGLLSTSSEDVGLPAGQMGNSEVEPRRRTHGDAGSAPHRRSVGPGIP